MKHYNSDKQHNHGIALMIKCSYMLLIMYLICNKSLVLKQMIVQDFSLLNSLEALKMFVAKEHNSYNSDMK